MIVCLNLIFYFPLKAYSSHSSNLYIKLILSSKWHSHLIISSFNPQYFFIAHIISIIKILNLIFYYPQIISLFPFKLTQAIIYQIYSIINHSYLIIPFPVIIIHYNPLNYYYRILKILFFLFLLFFIFIVKLNLIINLNFIIYCSILFIFLSLLTS